MTELNGLDATRLGEMLAAGEISAQDILDASLSRIDAREDSVRAWTWRSPTPDQTAAGQSAPQAPLRGIPVGVKDIMQTRDMPTGWGTRYLSAETSPCDAAAVALLRRAGAVLLGKTVSTELAGFTPGKTRNPHDLSRTPGGSSSGSAAAVADGMVPVALGTQTAGSIIRPASYCGVVGFKPSFGTVPMAGIKAFSPSLDTAGWFTRSVRDSRRVFGAMTASSLPVAAPPTLSQLRIGLAVVPVAGLEASTRQALDATGAALSQAGAQVMETPLPEGFDELAALHKRIMAYEAARALADEYDRHHASIGPKVLEVLDEGWTIGYVDYRRDQKEAARLNDALASCWQQLDVIITPSATGEAPIGHEATGDPIYSRAWTLPGLPAISLPLAKGPAGMPIGMQLIAPWGRDLELLDMAEAVMQSLQISVPLPA